MEFETVAAAFVARLRQALRCGGSLAEALAETLAETLAGPAGEAASDGAELRAEPPPPAVLRWPCFYINLASRPDRRRRMERMLQGQGVATLRVDAVTKEAPPVRAAPAASL